MTNLSDLYRLMNMSADAKHALDETTDLALREMLREVGVATARAIAYLLRQPAQADQPAVQA